MSKQEKILKKICETPTRSDITWAELKSCLEHLGYKMLPTGKTGGSRRKFFNQHNNQMITIHEPHPASEVKKVYITMIAAHLKDNGFVN